MRWEGGGQTERARDIDVAEKRCLLEVLGKVGLVRLPAHDQHIGPRKKPRYRPADKCLHPYLVRDLLRHTHEVEAVPGIERGGRWCRCKPNISLRRNRIERPGEQGSA